MGTYRISQLAERSGVAASTLRFYEQVGLLSAERTASGYRVYDDSALERLGLIGAAKHLGLGLEEIRELLGVWDQGVCATVRARLRPLVAARIAEGDRRIAELSAFTAHLAQVHLELGAPAPQGACGPDCGCLTTAPSRPGPMLVELTRTRPEPTPVVCTPGDGQQAQRTRAWQEVLAVASGREVTAEGLRVVSFPARPELAARIARLAAAEQDRGTFAECTLRLTPAALVLSVRGPQTATELVAELFGALP